MKKQLMAIICFVFAFLIVLPVSANENIVFTYEVQTDGTAMIMGCENEESLTELIIPEEVDGYKVTAIGGNAFSGCDNLEYVRIPQTITKLGQHDVYDYGVFYNCPKLKSAGPIGGNYNIEYGWETAIPDYAFYNMDSLETVTISNALESIGNRAFWDCDGLLKAELVDSVNQIGVSAFGDCDSLEYIYIPKGWMGSEYYTGNFFEDCPKLKTAGPVEGDFNIEYAWDKEIPDNVFHATYSLENFEFSESIEKIGEYAFEDCRALKEIAFSLELKEIGYSAFDGCDSLKEVILPSKLKKLGGSAFRDCDNLEHVKLPNSLTSFDFYGSCFMDCPKLETAGPTDGEYNIEFEWDIEIPDYAFSGCEYLESCELPDSIKHIGEGAFSGCERLGTVDFPANLQAVSMGAYEDCHALTEVILPNKEIEFAADAFASCNNLEKLVIPEKIKVLGGLAPNCSKLKTAGPIGGSYNIEFGWSKEIPKQAFWQHKDMESIVLPDTISKIGTYAFFECTGLTNINLPANLSVIEQSAFNGCSELTEVKLPSGIKTIEWRTFANCSELKNVVIPATVTRMESDSFYGCYKLSITGVEGSYAEKYASENKIPFIAIPALPYYDVKITDWYYGSVDYVASRGLMKGTSDTSFAPNDTLTRAQFATILYRADGESEVTFSNKFSDIPSGTWYSEAVIWAADAGIVTGFPGGLFKPNDSITREQMALMMYRYAKFKGADVSKSEELYMFVDSEKVSSWAEDALKWAVGNGLINGKGANNLDPQGIATRAECATIIMRFMQNLEY